MRFEAPFGRRETGLVPLTLPAGFIRDRSPDRVSAWALVSRTPGGAEESLAMERTANGFYAYVPAGRGPLFYRFQLRDAAGNVSAFPGDGVLTRNNDRRAILRLRELPRSRGEGQPDGDEWLVPAFGLPPVERLLAYRRIYAHVRHFPYLRQVLAAHGQTGVIELRDQASAREREPGYLADLSQLKAGTLPAPRADLLHADIVTERIPTPLLPDEHLLPAGTPREIRDAIRFRRLHEPAPAASPAPLPPTKPRPTKKP